MLTSIVASACNLSIWGRLRQGNCCKFKDNLNDSEFLLNPVLYGMWSQQHLRSPPSQNVRIYGAWDSWSVKSMTRERPVMKSLHSKELELDFWNINADKICVLNEFWKIDTILD